MKNSIKVFIFTSICLVLALVADKIGANPAIGATCAVLGLTSGFTGMVLIISGD